MAQASAELIPAPGEPVAQFQALSTIFDALDLVVYVSDLQTYQLLFVNARTEKTFGEGWRRKRCWEYLQSGQTGPCAFCTNDLLVREGVAQPPHSWEFRNTVNRRWYLCIDQAIPWTDGRLVRMEAAVDVTPRKEAERFREQYVGLVAHDLANPLNTVVLLSKVLERKLGAKGMSAELETLQQIVGNARRMEAMIRDLYESVRLEQGGLAFDFQPVDLVQLAEELIALMPEADRQRVSLRSSTRPAPLSGDGPRLQRMMQNLLSNALRLSPASEPVELEIDVRAEELTVMVSDHGPGIAPEHHAQVFDRSFRVAGTPTKGLGLGLYISRLVAEGHGGRISVESALGRGARFRCTIPTTRARP